jgi:uncharacterized protein (TIGR03086 family)
MSPTASSTGSFARLAMTRWGLPTPCDEWSVYDVANHVVGGGYYFIALMERASKDEALALLAQDFLQQNPVAAFDAQRPVLHATFHAPGALENVGHHVIVDMTGAELLRDVVAETAVHTSDSIRATSVEPQLDPALTEVALSIFAELAPMFTANGFTKPAIDIRAEAPVQDRLAALAGRQLGPLNWWAISALIDSRVRRS